MIQFVGAGPGAEDLITVRGQRLLTEADVVVYAGSLVNPGLLEMCKPGCEIHNSAYMTLEEVLGVLIQGEREQKKVVRLHTGDPCLYGAIREQMDALAEAGIDYEVCPGVSSFCGAAAALKAEYTLPDISQSVVITRMAGRTPVPEKESIRSFAAHQATMVVFLSTGMLGKLSGELIAGGYAKETPAAIVYKATWPDEEVHHCTVESLKETADKYGITKTALIVVGDVLGCQKDVESQTAGEGRKCAESRTAREGQKSAESRTAEEGRKGAESQTAREGRKGAESQTAREGRKGAESWTAREGRKDEERQKAGGHSPRSYKRSELYNPAFSTEFRRASKEAEKN